MVVTIWVYDSRKNHRDCFFTLPTNDLGQGCHGMTIDCSSLSTKAALYTLALLRVRRGHHQKSFLGMGASINCLTAGVPVDGVMLVGRSVFYRNPVCTYTVHEGDGSSRKEWDRYPSPLKRMGSSSSCSSTGRPSSRWDVSVCFALAIWTSAFSVIETSCCCCCWASTFVSLSASLLLLRLSIRSMTSLPLPHMTLMMMTKHSLPLTNVQTRIHIGRTVYVRS